jgi:hypothetical protein
MKKIPILFIALVICIAVLNAANLMPLLGPLLYTMTPLQRYYATAYLASSWHRNDPAATTETRLLWKMKKGKSELATEQDVVAKPVGELLGTYSPEPFLLSDKASAEGWTTVLRGRRQAINSAKLETFLELEIYDGNQLRQFFVQPVLGLATLIFVVLLIRAWRRERWARGWWNQNQPQLSFWAWSLETSERMTKRLLPRLKAPEILSALPTRQLELQAPAPERTLTASVAPAETKPTPKPAAVSPAGSAPTTRKPAVVQGHVPVVPAASAKPKPAFVWDESQGID